jgi:hypothetical protein
MYLLHKKAIQSMAKKQHLRLGHLWTLALRHYIHLYFFRYTTYFGVVSGVFLVLDAGFALIIINSLFIESYTVN